MKILIFLEYFATLSFSTQEQCNNCEDFIEFDSMINLRPSWGNHSRNVEDVDIRKKIITIVNKLVVT